MHYVVLQNLKVTTEVIQTLENWLYVVRVCYPMRVKTNDFSEVWNMRYTKKSRNMVRKAVKKGVIIKEINPFNYINEILAIHQSSPIRQGRPIDPHYLDPLKVKLYFFYFVKKSFFTKTYGAFYDKKLIGYLHVFKHENVMHVGRLMSDTKHFDKAPNDALITEMIKDCCNSLDIDFAQYYYVDFKKNEKRSIKSGVDHFKFDHGFRPYKEVVIVIPETFAEKIFIIIEKLMFSFGFLGMIIYSLVLGFFRRFPIPRAKSLIRMFIGHYYRYFDGNPFIL